jgi:hypothetical protein
MHRLAVQAVASGGGSTTDSSRRMHIMATAPNDARTTFVGKLVADPKQPPDTLLLTGYLGSSSDEGHTRLYFDAQLSSYVEIPDAAILHSQDMPKELSPLGGSYVWVKRDATLIHGPIGPNRRKASFLEGSLMQAPPAAPQIPPPTVAPVLCTEAGPVCNHTQLPLHCVPPTTPQAGCPVPTTPAAGCPTPTLIGTQCPTHIGPFCPPTHVAPLCPPTHVAPLCPPTHAAPLCPPTHVAPLCPPTHAAPLCPPTHYAPLCPPTHFGPACQFTHAGPLCHPTQLPLCHPTQPPLCHPTQPPLCHPTQPPLCLPVTQPPHCVVTLQPHCPHLTQPPLCLPLTHTPALCGLTHIPVLCQPVTGVPGCAPSLAGCPSGLVCGPQIPGNPAGNPV